MGKYDFGDAAETSSTAHQVESVKVHENYDRFSYENDIALIKLADNARINGRSVSPICLPRRGQDFADQRATVIGELCKI